MGGHRFTVVPGVWSVVRLGAQDPIPDWAMGGRFYSVTRTEEELSIVCPQEAVPQACRQEGAWALLKVLGPFPFSATGIFSSFAGPLADAGISIVALSTFDTDYLLVKAEAAERAVDVLRRAGHEWVRETP